MGWDGNKLHYFFNGVEISPQNNSEYGQIVSFHEEFHWAHHGESTGNSYFLVKMPWGLESIYVNKNGGDINPVEKHKYVHGDYQDYSIDYKIK